MLQILFDLKAHETYNSNSRRVKEIYMKLGECFKKYVTIHRTNNKLHLPGYDNVSVVYPQYFENVQDEDNFYSLAPLQALKG